VDVLHSQRGSIRLQRRVLRHEAGVRLLQRFEGSGTRAIITHSASITAEVNIERGEVRFPLTNGPIVAPQRFLMTIPAGCVVAIEFRDAIVSSDGISTFDELSGKPALDGMEILDADAGVRPALVRARQLLHERLSDPAPVRSVAREVGLAAETLTRLFARAYVVAPKEYVHRARLFAAVLRILAGWQIVDSAFESGFSDVSRFYQQFRRLIGATPGTYARVRNRQDHPSDLGP
jgi:AraC-like DNA-binding protein